MPSGLSAQQAHPDESKSFDQKLAWSLLNKQCDFGPRVPGSEAHKKCRDFLQAELAKSCQSVRLQPFTHTWSTTKQPIQMWNVIGDQNWKNATIRIALFAHWDSRPTADQETDPASRAKPILGANDGASGVAVLVELARVLKDRLPSDIGITYVLIDGEDLGPGEDEMYLGALEYAKAMPTPRPNYGILLDMIGGKTLRVPIEPNSLQFARRLELELYRHANDVDLGSAFPNYEGPAIDDDHIPLNLAKLPTIDLIDFNYEPWHTLRDTPENCSPVSLGKVGKLLETWILRPERFKP